MRSPGAKPTRLGGWVECLDRRGGVRGLDEDREMSGTLLVFRGFAPQSRRIHGSEVPVGLW